VQTNDVFVLCSDGLHGLVKELELKQIAGLPIDQAATEYVRVALSRGAPDNVTVIVAKIVPVDELGKEPMLDADETLADHPLDETQRDTAPIVPITEDEPIGEDTGDVLETTVETPIQTEPLAKTVETVKPASGGSFLKWALIAILILGGAAGGWQYWKQHHQGTPNTHSK
jgi:hypothetical protein